MDKEFILEHLKDEHLTKYSELEEVAEVSGMEVAKILMKNHESMRLYIPTLNSNRKLMKDVIIANCDKMKLWSLAEKTGLTRDKLKQYIEQIRKEQQSELFRKD